MPAALIARHLTVTRGPRTILADLDLHLDAGRRVGVIGPNGIGKSTLLRALAGRVDDAEAVVTGAVDLAPASATVGYLPQESERRAAETVEGFLARRTGVAQAQVDLDIATRALSVGAPGADDRYSLALDRWLALGAADFEARVGRVFAELGIDAPLRARLTTALSGGEMARTSLASLLLARFDVMLLDEPTNDLDLDGLERLERWVTALDVPVALVSHDRAFLERTITDVVEIDHHSHRATWFAGGWNAFRAERELARRRAQERFDQYDTQRQSLLDRRQREREWAAKGAGRARRSDERDKHIRHHQLNQTEQLAGRSAQTDRALERLEAVDEPRTPWELRYDIPVVARSGDIVATANGAVVDRGAFRLGPVDLDIGWGDRVAIVGANGSGKTTLLELLLGRIIPTRGAPDWARTSSSAKSPRHAIISSGRDRSSTGSVPPPRWRPATRARCSPSSVSMGTISTARPPRCLRASERESCSQISWQAGRTCSCSTNRPITSTSRPSNSSNQRSTASTGPCSSSRTIEHCSDRSGSSARCMSRPGR